MNDGFSSIRLLGKNDAETLEGAAHLFDRPLMRDELLRFLESDRDFLWLAFEHGLPIGFVSATMIRHPDAHPVLFVNEIAVEDETRRRGLGSRLMRAVFDLANERGWQSTWVLAGMHDEQAKAFYQSLAPDDAAICDKFEWERK
jgi:ribosomal protein S18 acetylase RimI-like enzyme